MASDLQYFLQELDAMETTSVTTTSVAATDFESMELDSIVGDLAFDLADDCLDPKGQVMLAHIKTPGEFYIHLISQQSGQTLDKLMKALNMVFERVNRRKLTKLSKTFEPAIGKLCCAQFTQDENFYR